MAGHSCTQTAQSTDGKTPTGNETPANDNHKEILKINHKPNIAHV